MTAPVIENPIEEIHRVLLEAQAICSFLDEALDSLFCKDSRFIDDIHKESPHGLHLCFLAALERLERARNLIDNETGREARHD